MSRALYGKGLLRIWVNNLYARVLSFQETPLSKKAVLDLGRLIGAGRKNTLPPRLLNFLPADFGSDWKIQRKTITYFRSHLVLNSFYFLSYKNILNLDHSTEACLSQYKKKTVKGKGTTFFLLFIKYVHPQKARLALNRFVTIYLPEYKKNNGDKTSIKTEKLAKIEDGWMGYHLKDKLLTLVFGCPDKKIAMEVFDSIQKNICKEEKDG